MITALLCLVGFGVAVLFAVALCKVAAAADDEMEQAIRDMQRERKP